MTLINVLVHVLVKLLKKNTKTKLMKSKNKKPNAWITGHTGFIGQQLTNELKQKYEIFKVSRNDIIEKNKYFKKK